MLKVVKQAGELISLTGGIDIKRGVGAIASMCTIHFIVRAVSGTVPFFARLFNIKDVETAGGGGWGWGGRWTGDLAIVTTATFNRRSSFSVCN